MALSKKLSSADSVALNLEAETFWAIYVSAKKFDELQQQWAAHLGLSSTQWIILRALRDIDTDSSGISGKELATKIQVSPSFISAQTKELESKGWIRRLRSTGDVRIIYLSLTAFASDKLSTIEPFEIRLGRQLLANQDVDELVSMRTMCLKIQKEITKIILFAKIASNDSDH